MKNLKEGSCWFLLLVAFYMIVFRGDGIEMERDEPLE